LLDVEPELDPEPQRLHVLGELPLIEGRRDDPYAAADRRDIGEPAKDDERFAGIDAGQRRAVREAACEDEEPGEARVRKPEGFIDVVVATVPERGPQRVVRFVRGARIGRSRLDDGPYARTTVLQRSALGVCRALPDTDDEAAEGRRVHGT
jgi:hypothetical protein